MLVEQGLQRELGRRERVARLAARERALREHLEVAGLVVDVAGEPEEQLRELRVDVGEEARRDVQRRVLVLRDERHDLGDGALDVVAQALRGLPGDLAGGVPLLRGCLLDELAHVVGPQRVAVPQRPGVAGRARLGHGAEGSEARLRLGAVGWRRAGSPIRGVQLAAAERRARTARGQRPGEHARGPAAPDEHAPRARLVAFPHQLVPRDPRPAGQLERDAARRRPDLEDSAGRHALQRGRQEHLQPAAEFQALRVDAMRDGNAAAPGHGNRPCARIAASSDA